MHSKRVNFGQNLIGYFNMPALLYAGKYIEDKIWLVISSIAIMRNDTPYIFTSWIYGCGQNQVCNIFFYEFRNIEI